MSTSWGEKKIFTTGEAAEICKVSQQTIIRCFDSGRLTGFRVPGSKFRRIPRDELIRFMKANNIPVDHLEGGVRRILVVDDDPNITELFEDVFSRDARFSGRFDVKTASTGYDAGLLTESFRPHLIILDYMLPDIHGNVVCTRIRASSELSGTKILCVSGAVDPAQVRVLREAGADDFLKKPFTIEALAERMFRLLGIEAGSNAVVPPRA